MYMLVVGPFPEIKTGYWGFETNEIRYFICLLVCSKIIRTAYMKQNLKLEMAFVRNHYVRKYDFLLNIK